MVEQEVLEEVLEEFRNSGIDAGKEILSLATEIHGKDILFSFPLYRSCIVILKQNDVSGLIKMVVYHDPCWMGRERSVESLPDFREDLTLFGQRSGFDIAVGELFYDVSWVDTCINYDISVRASNRLRESEEVCREKFLKFKEDCEKEKDDGGDE